ncbi:hypothetical protein C0Q70_09691 [Pomacea canaliculata]|uniref:Homeobox domain-containing protein n=1 Tax=Pomacea canaliculata TaxID=400727 RepID=A0A2T7PAH1_POMCA|nr:hypothetical protein C0Q70_09691 [Pomacea canaliculata]
MNCRVVAFVGERVFDLRQPTKTAPVNPILEKVYAKKKTPDNSTIQDLSKQTDMKVRQIERWFRHRRNQDRTPVIKKFCESSWRCTYYAVIFCYGMYTLWDKEWLWKTEMCWKGWPEHHVSADLYWYYAIQAGFYLSLSLSLFVDHKRKDFMEMIVHHFATLGLMFFSWMNNFVRVGSLVLLIHDCADPIMEAAKMAKYVKKDGVCNSLFVLFILTWIATRMTIFPFRIIYSTLFEAVPEIGICFVYYVYNTLLITLQVLHIIWFYFIVLIAKEAIITGGQVKKDSRSSDETISDDSSSNGKECSKRREHPINKNGLAQLEQNGTVNPLSCGDRGDL